MNEEREPDGKTPVEEVLRWVDRVAVDEEKLATFQSEEDFMELAVELTKEITSYTCVAASIFEDKKGWSRNRAAISGNIVRIYKLLHGFLDNTCQRRDELAFIFQRLIFEGIVNVRYMMQNFSEDLIHEYLVYSLQHERNLRSIILNNIEKRGGKRLPIEERMLKSIEYTMKKSEIAFTDIPEKRMSRWGSASLRDKADSVGLGAMYLAAIGGGSNSIHGNWQEISGNNLEWDEMGYFKPKMDWRRPRPQVSLSISICIADTLKMFFKFVTDNDAHNLIDKALDDVLIRLILVQDYHEDYLRPKNWPEV